MRKTQLANDNLYHIYNRGTEKRDIFLDKSDYFRFIHYLYEFNDTKVVAHILRKLDTGRGLASANSANWKQRELLVEIVSFCLMPNHFHLILRQMKDSGIAKFMQRVGTGHTMYFNKKNQRTGTLFQGTFKSILIENDEYLTHLSRYIHINPVELIEPSWKKEGIKDWNRANEFLQTYRWSSYLDYIGIKNFPSLTNREIINSYFQSEQSYKNFINQWLVDDLEFIKQAILE